MATSTLLARASRIQRTLLCTPQAKRKLHYINASKVDFEKVVQNGPNDRVVLVDFFADWCGPCHALSPILHRLTTERASGSGSQLDLVTLDVDSEEKGGQALAQQYKVHALPTVVAFRGGKPVDRFVGALNEGGVAKFLDKL